MSTHVAGIYVTVWKQRRGQSEQVWTKHWNKQSVSWTCKSRGMWKSGLCAVCRTTGLCLGSAGRPGISVWNDYGNVKWVSSPQGRTSSRSWDVCSTTPTAHWERERQVFSLSAGFTNASLLISPKFYFLQFGSISNSFYLCWLRPKSWNKALAVITFSSIIIVSLICPPSVCRSTHVWAQTRLRTSSSLGSASSRSTAPWKSAQTVMSPWCPSGMPG